MKLFIRISLVSLFLFANSAHAFFFVIPTGAISDLVTGAEGKHCVTNAAKVGDKMPLANGKVGEIKSLSGTSTRCTNGTQPIRALIEPVDIPPIETTFTIQNPLDMELSTLTDVNRFNSLVTQATKKEPESGFQVFSVKKHTVPDINEYVEKRRAGILLFVLDGKMTPITAIKINQIPALQFEVSGAFKNGTDAKYFVTILDGQEDVVQVIMWTRIDEYDLHKPDFLRILNTSGGMIPAANTGIVVEGSIEGRTKKCTQMGLIEKTKKFNDCLSLLAE
jgi:hypothetical protein